ncbi:aminotransferase DegT [Candidatus Saccharibacteria bacterium RIFCSPHIGHO2_02_FULL_47_12]|nr:MAG: aminotransferase DegT [Candidatus Saccharibacteria bacterium RIFCSPHIGHO2_02_FULL_47_12]
MERINVTKTFLPPIEEYHQYVREIWQNGQITNQGPLLVQLEDRLEQHLGVSNLHFVANGTVALQLAIKALGIEDGEIITSPFSYVASTSAILWEKCTPVFVDIEPDTFCIDPDKIEAAITDKTRAILAVHVFGYPCDIEKIEEIAKNHKLKVIYDSAHAFGASYNGKSLMSYGDISTGSFHATKLFHTVEGGCVIVNDKLASDKVELMKRFGHNGDDHIMLGINAKSSELHAAMGLCNLKYADEIIQKRKAVSEKYEQLLGDKFLRPKAKEGLTYNYAYYPIIFESEEQLLSAVKQLNDNNIFPRRYFFPSLNELSYIESSNSCPISEDISRRILCLPLYDSLDNQNIEKICEVLSK